MTESSPEELPSIVRTYIDELPVETRKQLLRAAVLRWFNEPLFRRVNENLSESVDFHDFIHLPMVVRTSRNTYSVASSMKENLVTILREESIDSFGRVNLLAADFFHRPIDDVSVTQVSTVIEEIAYLSMIDQDLCAERMSEFGYRALLSGWVEAADRAGSVAQPAIIQGSEVTPLSAAVRLLEGAVSTIVHDSRPSRSELRRLTSLADEVESSSFSSESLRTLATLVHDVAVTREQSKNNWLEVRDLPWSDVSHRRQTQLQVYGSADESELHVDFKIGSFSLRAIARSGSALLAALVSVILAFAGAGVGALLGNIRGLASVWAISGFFTPAVIFSVLQASSYIVKRNDQRMERRVRGRE